MNISIIIVSILLLGFLFIATANFTNVNKAAVAMFTAVTGWVLYICFGTDFVTAEHPREYLMFLLGDAPSAENAKLFISQNVFIRYIGRAAEVVLFLLATMSIIEILDNNGCFDFLTDFFKTRNSRKLLWYVSAVSFALSCSIDNVSVTIMMLLIVHKLIANKQYRMYYGCAVLIAVTCGGCMTVIGDPVGLVLWSREAVTATNFTASLVLPCMIAAIVPIYLISRKLPERMDLQTFIVPFRGDDTRLTSKQQIIMFAVSFACLWLVPTFTKFTHLSPFLGAMCVLAVVWIVNEGMNRKLINSEQMVQQRRPRAIQYMSIQTILYIIGIMLTLGVVKETGYLNMFADKYGEFLHNDVFLYGTIAGIVSTFLDTFTTAFTSFEMFDIDPVGVFAQNGPYWKIISYCTAMGGIMFCVGSMSGITYLKMEKITLRKFFRMFTGKIFLGWLLGMIFLYMEVYFFNFWK